MIEVKAHDVVDRTFSLKELSGTPQERPWNLTGCTVAAFVRIHGNPTTITAVSTITDPIMGQVRVRLDTTITDVAFGAAERARDAILEIQVTKSDGSKETVPSNGFLPIKIYADLNGA